MDYKSGPAMGFSQESRVIIHHVMACWTLNIRDLYLDLLLLLPSSPPRSRFLLFLCDNPLCFILPLIPRSHPHPTSANLSHGPAPLQTPAEYKYLSKCLKDLHRRRGGRFGGLRIHARHDAAVDDVEVVPHSGGAGVYTSLTRKNVSWTGT